MRIFLCLFLVASPYLCLSQKVTSTMANGVFAIKVPSPFGMSSGTAFLTTYKKDYYVITAKHLFIGYKNGDSVRIGFVKDTAVEYLVMKMYCDNGQIGADVAVLTSDISGIGYEVSTLDSARHDGSLGENIFFLGFPSTNVVANNIPINSIYRGRPMAVLKKSILAGFDDSKSFNMTAIFDTQSAPGFSGSPVYLYDEKQKSFYLFAVMAGGYLSNAQVSDGANKVEMKDLFYLTSLSYGPLIRHAIYIIETLIKPTK